MATDAKKLAGWMATVLTAYALATFASAAALIAASMPSWASAGAGPSRGPGPRAVGDVVQGVAKLSQALIRDKRLETLWLLPASQTRDKDALTEVGVAGVIKEMRSKFDWVICDSPAGIERGATLAMRFADAAVVVTNPEVSSVRDSDRIIGLLDSKTEKAERGEQMEKHILITRYDAQRAQRGEMLNIEDVLEILSIPLLGIIPESREVLRASNVGSPVTLCNATSAPARAYLNAARRLNGDVVPMSIPTEHQRLLGKLFGRRAA